MFLIITHYDNPAVFPGSEFCERKETADLIAKCVVTQAGVTKVEIFETSMSDTFPTRFSYYDGFK